MSSVPRPPVRRTRSDVKEYTPPGPRTMASNQPSAGPSMGHGFLKNWTPPPANHMPPGYSSYNERREQPDPEPPGPPKPPEEFPAKLTLKLEAEDRDTDLARICSDALHELPQMVKVGEKFSVKGNDVQLQKGESLLLLFVAELPRVHAVDTTSGKEVWLPVHAEQLYETLPMDPRLDDKLYTGVTAMMNSNPMPCIVRVLEGYSGSDYAECVDQEDVIRISHIEEKVRRYSKERILIAQNQVGHRLELHKDMDCAHFTTMMSALFLHMSELIGLDFPQRVRVVEETNFEKRKPKEEKVFKLLSFKNDLQVIATRSRKPGLLSIPLSVPISLNTTSFKDKTVQSCLPPLFPPVNLTWGVREFGRPTLPEPLREISQPLPEPLRGWLESFEGKERVCKVAKVSKEDLIQDLKEMTNYTKDLTNRIACLDQVDKPLIPTRDKPVAPPRPPTKPLTYRSLPAKPDMKPVVCSPKPKLTPKPKPRSFTAPKQPSDSKVLNKRRVSTDDGYEVPGVYVGSDIEEEEGDEYEVVPDVNDPTKPLDVTTQELKNILQQKEKKIASLKEENEQLKEKCEKLEKEKREIRVSNFKNVDEINRLQAEIDRMLARNDGDMYDFLIPTERPLPTLPTSPGAVIYNSPHDLLSEKVLMSRADIEGVSDILRQLNLGKYVEKFREEAVDGALLVTLDDSVLKEDLGMTGLHARKLLLEVKKYTK
ncbi:uncharacterized protein LOC119731519 [Patiria miniata]|uniref:SAM domain-containing protein n=1 Tax=Patiria miniata TaxID=46514 RepID=A0A914AA26_PATMI|nr:uncharacterized protein LOC119731519 [Patiria miniata]